MFGSKFVAMKQATEYIRSLRYKLRVIQLTSQLLSLGTTNWYWLIQLPLAQHWRRNPMPLHIILYGRAVPVMNGRQHTSTQTRMWLIFWVILWLVPNELSLFKCYSIIMFDTRRGEDYDVFKRIRTSTCLPSWVSLWFFHIVSKWGFMSFLDFPIFPSGINR